MSFAGDLHPSFLLGFAVPFIPTSPLVVSPVELDISADHPLHKEAFDTVAKWFAEDDNLGPGPRRQFEKVFVWAKTALDLSTGIGRINQIFSHLATSFGRLLAVIHGLKAQLEDERQRNAKLIS